ncbi:chromate efflux transporter [Undibacterium sp. TS12]|uniref:chromate efflux transporter n=1 Tax=Undibacterium sp. TS12 TaxID=2908202 RepID=UPI001F4CC1E1|nr:chromate efflux transporter [Undibacterium sp. TS12]MCH8621659.1 chromate efflux transporter [Undibacterium sp. TS12]
MKNGQTTNTQLEKNQYMSSNQISLKTAFLYWLKLGFISFGGPAGQIALMHADLVEKRRWISEARFLHALNYCMLLPGPEATQLAIYIGWLMHKTRGGIMAGLLFVLPGFLVLILLSWIYMRFGNHEIVKIIMSGVKPAVVAIVLTAAWRIARRSLKTKLLMAVATMAFLSISFLHLPFPVIILSAAVTGLVFRHACEAHHPSANAPGLASQAHPAALIDDDTPTPAHAHFSLVRLLMTVGLSILSVVAVWLLLATAFGTTGPLTDMANFFSKAAMLSFGGAYAVLPYMVQAAVEQYHWLNMAQMMDGLALGETTPGPLIMIVAFVGFIGGWNNELFGANHLLLSACLGAGVAFFFTFFPSFVFILAGGPLVEASRNNLRLNAPLNAISAAVVGVILSLAWLFAGNVFFHEGTQIDLFAVGITVTASVATFRYQVSTIKLLAACALAAYGLSLFH